jgi:hypothetical protein
MVVDDAVGRSSETVPECPKTAGGIRAGNVVGVLTEKMAVVAACGRVSNRARIKG